MQQLKSANLIAYAKFMQLGYPLRVSFDSLNAVYEQYIAKSVLDLDISKLFYKKLMLSNGFALKDFRFGENLIFFRSKCQELMEQLLESPTNSMKKLKSYSARSKIRVIAFCFIFLNGSLPEICYFQQIPFKFNKYFSNFTRYVQDM